MQKNDSRIWRQQHFAQQISFAIVSCATNHHAPNLPSRTDQKVKIAGQGKSEEMSHMIRKAATLFAALLLFAGVLPAQDYKSDVSVEGTGVFTKDANNNNVLQKATQTGGVLAGYRYHLNRWVAAEANYGYFRNTQLYFTTTGPSRIQANVHEITGALVITPKLSIEKLHPFALAGGGGLVFDPTGNHGGSFPGATSETKGAFLYGGGADYDLIKRIALRLEYRGFVYKSPTFNLTTLNADEVTHIAQPSAGIVFKF
jgi:outer membrane immunogenic protein